VTNIPQNTLVILMDYRAQIPENKYRLGIYCYEEFHALLETQEDGHSGSTLNLLGIKTYFSNAENVTTSQYFDFVSKDPEHDTYMTMCCLDYFVKLVWLFHVSYKLD
jgi:hypothetical protein